MAKKEQAERPPKPKKEKKPKPPKKPKKGQQPPVEDELLEQEGEQPVKKKKINPLLLILVLVVVLAAIAAVVIFVLLPIFRAADELPPAPQESEPVYYDLPEEFKVGEESVSAMAPLERNGVQAAQSVRVMYTYTGLTDAGKEVSSYVSSLVSTQKFFVVDPEFVRTDAPDFTVPEGQVLLARNLPKAQTSDAAASPSPDTPPQPEPPDMVLTVEITWSEGTCVVVCDQAEGKVTSPPRDETKVPTAIISMTEAERRLAELPPSVLELEGASMSEYSVMARDGTVIVDGRTCMRMNVYYKGGTNGVAGRYLMTVDGAHLYLLEDEEKGIVRELKLP